MREVLDDPQHSENYWLSERLENEHLICHFCKATYACVVSLQSHEQRKHSDQFPTEKPRSKVKNNDQLQDNIVMLFKLVILHKNLDMAVDMGDGERFIRSAKYSVWTASIQQDKQSKIPDRFCSSYSLNFKYWHSLRGTETKTGCEQICECSKLTK